MSQRRPVTRRSITLAKWKGRVSVLLLGGSLLHLPVPALAQTTNGGKIRVKSDEVFVPVLVLDKQRVANVQHMKLSAFDHHWVDGDVDFLQPLAVPGLSIKDFTVLQDGEPQRIVSVVPEAQRQAPIVTDNLSKYREYVGVGGGTWAVPLWEYIGSPKTKIDESPSFSGYAIGFIPPPSSSGSCHKIQIIVDRPNSLVFARNEYCHASRMGADPLRGTALGIRIESDLQNKTRNELSLNLAAIPLFADDGTVGVRIVLDYAPRVNPVTDSCDSAANHVGIVGMFLGQNGQEVLRFSDEATGWGDNSLSTKLFYKLGQFLSGNCAFYAPIRYETEIDTPAGNYHLQIGFMDGQTFGRAAAAVTVPSDPNRQLSIGGIVLATRFREPRLQPLESPVAVTARPFRGIPTEPAKSATTLPENYLPLMTKGIEITPTANARFKRKGQFYFYVQVYEPRSSETPRPSVELNVRIVSDKTKEVVRQLQPINAAPYQLPDSPVIPIGGGILIANLPKGSYTLQAKATDSTGASTPWSSAAFSIQ